MTRIESDKLKDSLYGYYSENECARCEHFFFAAPDAGECELHRHWGTWPRSPACESHEGIVIG